MSCMPLVKNTVTTTDLISGWKLARPLQSRRNNTWKPGGELRTTCALCRRAATHLTFVEKAVMHTISVRTSIHGVYEV